MQKIYSHLIIEIKKFFEETNNSTAFIGLSGGIDSAVVACLLAEVIGSENVKAVLLPSHFSSKSSIDDAVELANNLKIEYETIKIAGIFDNIISELSIVNYQLAVNKGKEELMEENLQARIRAVILMAMANKYSALVVNTSNKSEIATGYGTLYGDSIGAISVLGDLYKTQVYELADFINQSKKIIPQNIIDKEPSAELKFNQKDSDNLPEYEILDKILFQYIDLKKSKDEIKKHLGHNEIVDITINLVEKNKFKSLQLPPAIRCLK